MTHPFDFRLLFASTVVLACFVTAPYAVAQEEGQPELSEAQSKLQQAFDQAQELVDNEEYDQAISAFTRLITATGSYNPQPYVKRAEVYMLIEDYEQAEEDLNEAITYATGIPLLAAKAQALRGEVYMEQGNVAQALPDLQAAASEFRDSSPKVQFLLGKAQVMTGDAKTGADTLTNYLGLDDPEFDDNEAEVYRLRASAYAGLRRFDDAKADLENAISVDPENHENYMSQASILMAEKDYSGAAQAFAEVIKNYVPEDENDDLPPTQAYLARAAALEEVGREATSEEEKDAAYEEGKAAVMELLEALPDRPELAGIESAAQFRMGILQRLLDDLPAAIKALTAAIDLNPQAQPEFIGQAQYRRGICFFYLDEEELALLDFQAAAGRIYTDPRAKFWEGRTHAKLGNYLDAIRAYGEAIAVSDRYSDAFVHRGLAYFQLGEYEKAITDFNEAIRLKPIDGTPYYYRGVAYSLMEEQAKAVNSLTNAIKFDPKLVPAYRFLADELRKSGQEELAGEYDRRADELESSQTS